MKTRTQHLVHFEERLELWDQSILWLRQNAHETVHVEVIKCHNDREPPHELRDHSVTHQVPGLHAAKEVVCLLVLREISAATGPTTGDGVPQNRGVGGMAWGRTGVG